MRARKETIALGIYFVFLIFLFISAWPPEATPISDEVSSSEESPFSDLVERISLAEEKALQRAKEWVDAEVSYSRTPQPVCFGFVSYAWELPPEG